MYNPVSKDYKVFDKIDFEFLTEVKITDDFILRL
jgi:hypothetical protein